MRSEVNPMRSIPILLDGDPGHDDAIAWMLANASPRLEIRAVTSVSGNQTIEKTTYNALRVMALSTATAVAAASAMISAAASSAGLRMRPAARGGFARARAARSRSSSRP